VKKICENPRNLWQKSLGGIVLLLVFPMLVSGQSFSSLSKYEKRWAFFHPFASLKIKKHKTEMTSVYNEVKIQNVLDQYENGGKLDAFRHVFAMAYFSKYVCVRKLRKLGKAHEKGNYLQYLNNENENGELPDSLSSVMDLKNNELGFSLAKEIKKLSAVEIKQKVIEQIKTGNAFIIKRNADGLYIDCSGNIISHTKLYKRWDVPKCLVASKE
jgi:hypothetical protein